MLNVFARVVASFYGWKWKWRDLRSRFAPFVHPFSLPGGPLQIRKAYRFNIPLSPGICSRWSHIPLRLRRGYANKKVKGPSEQAQGPFTFLSAVRAGFEPAVRLPVRQFSKLVVSATHPSHQADPFFPMGLQRYK